MLSARLASSGGFCEGLLGCAGWPGVKVKSVEEAWGALPEGLASTETSGWDSWPGFTVLPGSHQAQGTTSTQMRKPR